MPTIHRPEAPVRSGRPAALALALAAGALLAGLLPAPADAQGPAVIYVVRHAEKVDDGTADPPLAPAGIARARALGERLAMGGLDVVYSTQFRRNVMTAEAVAERTGAEVRIREIGSGDIVAQIRELASEVAQRNPGRRVLVVGHSNTVPLLVQALTGADPGPISDGDYDDLFTIEAPGRYRLEAFGSATPSPTGTPRPMAAATQRPPQPPTPVAPPPTPGPLGEDSSKTSIAEVIEKVIESRGLQTAVAAWGELSRYSRQSYDFSEPLLDELGQRYLDGGEPIKAIIVLEMNAQGHPESARAFARLGGAYLAARDRQRAVAAYRHALELDPENAMARKALEEIQG